MKDTHHVEEQSLMRELDGIVEVGVAKDDVGALATELEGDPLDVVGRSPLNNLAHLSGAGEGHLVHVRVVGDGSSGGRAEARNNVDDSRRESGFLDQAGDVKSREWGLFGQLKGILSC